MGFIPRTESVVELHEPLEWLPAEIVAVEEKEGNFGPQLRFAMIVDDDERETWVYTSLSYNPSPDFQSKLFQVANAALGGKAPEDGIDPSSLVGTSLDIMFEQYTTDQGNTREKATKFRPSRH